MLVAVSLVYGIGALCASAALDATQESLADPASPGAFAVYGAAWAAAAGVGSLLLIRRPEHRVGWLFLGLGAALGTWGLAESYGAWAISPSAPRPGGAGAAVLANSAFIVVLLLVALVCSLTPDDRFLSGRWRLAAQTMVLAGAAWFGLRLVSPQPLDEPFGSVQNPWALTGVDLGAVRFVLAILTMALVLVCAVSVLVRFRRSTGEVRRQLWWVVAAAVPIPLLLSVAVLAALTDHVMVLTVATVGAIVLIPLGTGVAVLRYRLYDVEQVLSRTVTYVLVSSLIVGTYVAVVVVVAYAAGDAADRSPLATTLATLAAVVIAQPSYGAIRTALDRRFQRRRFDAVRAVRAYVVHPPGDRQVETVLRQALADPGLRVAYWNETGERWVTEVGHEIDLDDGAVPVERAGRLVAAVKTGCDDGELVRAVLHEAAPELENARLRAAVAVQLEEVRASRERIAEAQINERRRIERDLHDGAQQRLLGAAAQMRAALLNGSSDRLRAALELGAGEAQAVVAELRALANGLHPAVLDHGGLSSALSDLAARAAVSVELTSSTARHPPIVEATLWFVACEAIANATKHAGAAQVKVELDDDAGLVRLVIDDDGCGGADPSGSGLRGIADRVEAAGGSLVLRSPAGGGTRVEAVIPCAS